MTYRGHVQNGTVVIDEPSHLREGAAVSVEVVHKVPCIVIQDENPTLFERLLTVVAQGKQQT